MKAKTPTAKKAQIPAAEQTQVSKRKRGALEDNKDVPDFNSVLEADRRPTKRHRTSDKLVTATASPSLTSRNKRSNKRYGKRGKTSSPAPLLSNVDDPLPGECPSSPPAPPHLSPCRKNSPDKGKKLGSPATSKTTLVSAMKRKGEISTILKVKAEKAEPQLERKKVIVLVSDDEETATQVHTEHSHSERFSKHLVEKRTPFLPSKIRSEVTHCLAQAGTKAHTTYLLQKSNATAITTDDVSDLENRDRLNTTHGTLQNTVSCQAYFLSTSTGRICR